MRTYLLSVLDRAGRTALHVVAGYLVAGRGQVDWRVIALATALAVAVSVLQSVVDFPAIPGGWIGDVTGRAMRTFAQTAVGSIGAVTLFTDVSWSTVLSAAALAALASVVTSAVATPLGAVKGTPDLVDRPAYVGYVDAPKHLRAVPQHTTASVAVGVAAVGAFLAIATVGAVSAHHVPTRILAAPPAPVTAVQPTPLDRTPMYLAALQRVGIPTGNPAALLVIGNSVCAQRGVSTDAQQTDHLLAAFPQQWTRAQAALIVDAAIDQLC